MDAMTEEHNWHTAWLRHTLERMDEMDKRGEKEVTLYVLDFQRILMELLAMHQRADRLEEVLCSYAKYAFPANQYIEPPTVFGGSRTGRFTSTTPNFTEQEKRFGKLNSDRKLGQGDRRKVGGSARSGYDGPSRTVTGDRRLNPEHVFSTARGGTTYPYKVCTKCHLSDVYVESCGYGPNYPPCKP